MKWKNPGEKPDVAAEGELIEFRGGPLDGQWYDTAYLMNGEYRFYRHEHGHRKMAFTEKNDVPVMPKPLVEGVYIACQFRDDVWLDWRGYR